MLERPDYSLIEKFIDHYQPQGFDNINPQDSLVLELESYLKKNKQFLYIADLMLMKVRFISQNSYGVLGVDSNTFDLSSIISRVHRDDYHQHNLARAMVIKKGYELLINKKEY